MEKLKDINVHITSGSIISVLLFLVLAAMLWFLRDIVLILVTAVVIASAMEPAIGFLTKHKVNRILAVILTYLSVISAFLGVLLVFVPPVLGDAASFLARLPETLSSFNISAALTDTTGGVFTTLSAFFGGLTSFVLIVVFSFYFSMQETGVDDFLRIVTPNKNQAYVLGLWKRSQEKIGKWMQGQLVLALIVGILLYLGLTILGIPNALLLAVIAGLFELIPVFGQIIAAVP